MRLGFARLLIEPSHIPPTGDNSTIQEPIHQEPSPLEDGSFVVSFVFSRQGARIGDHLEACWDTVLDFAYIISERWALEHLELSSI